MQTTKTKKWNARLWLGLVATPLLSATALGAVGSTDPRRDELSLAQARNVFREFRIRYEAAGVDPVRTVELRGLVHASCKAHFQIVSGVESSVGGEKAVGFRIIDETVAGVSGTQCMANHANTKADVRSGEWLRLDQLEGSKPNLDLSTLDSAKIAIFQKDYSTGYEENVAWLLNDEAGVPLRHRGHAEIQAEAEAEAEILAKLDLEKDLKLVDRCRNNMNELDIAFEALDRLRDQLDDKSWQSKRRSLSDREFELINEALEAALATKDARELAAVEEDLFRWLDANSGADNAEKAFGVCSDIGTARIELGGANAKVEDYFKASQASLNSGKKTLERCAKISGLSAQNLEKAALALDTIRTDQVRLALEEATENPRAAGAALKAYNALDKEAQNDLLRAQRQTRTACSGRRAYLESCSASMLTLQNSQTRLQKIRMLPFEVQQEALKAQQAAAQQQFKMQMELEKTRMEQLQKQNQQGPQGVSGMPNALPNMPNMQGMPHPQRQPGSSPQFAPNFH